MKKMSVLLSIMGGLLAVSLLTACDKETLDQFSNTFRNVNQNQSTNTVTNPPNASTQAGLATDAGRAAEPRVVASPPPPPPENGGLIPGE